MDYETIFYFKIALICIFIGGGRQAVCGGQRQFCGSGVLSLPRGALGVELR